MTTTLNDLPSDVLRQIAFEAGTTSLSDILALTSTSKTVNAALRGNGPPDQARLLAEIAMKEKKEKKENWADEMIPVFLNRASSFLPSHIARDVASALGGAVVDRGTEEEGFASFYQPSDPLLVAVLAGGLLGAALFSVNVTSLETHDGIRAHSSSSALDEGEGEGEGESKSEDANGANGANGSNGHIDVLNHLFRQHQDQTNNWISRVVEEVRAMHACLLHVTDGFHRDVSVSKRMDVDSREDVQWVFGSLLNLDSATTKRKEWKRRRVQERLHDIVRALVTSRTRVHGGDKEAALRELRTTKSHLLVYDTLRRRHPGVAKTMRWSFYDAELAGWTDDEWV